MESDGRRRRGDRTRRAVAAEAAALASIDGLAGTTLGRLAEALGMTKSSVQAAYRTKEELQVAAVAAATDIFVDAVVTPALSRPEGLSRLLALVDLWLSYVERRVFPGGCFMVATLSEYDSRPDRFAMHWHRPATAGLACSSGRRLRHRLSAILRRRPQRRRWPSRSTPCSRRRT